MRPPRTYMQNTAFIAFFKTFLLTFFVLNVGPVYAHFTPDPKKNCADYLRELHSNLDIVGSDSFAEALSEENPTLRLDGVRDGKHGGQLLLVERVGKRWGSAFTTMSYDPQGDPRWFLDILGAEASKYFGFEIIDDAHMTVPDFEEFDGALRKVNEELVRQGQEPTAILFHSALPGEKSSVSKYMKTFLDESVLPMATSGNQQIHDISFHTGAIFLPPDLVNAKIQRLKYERDFFQFLKNKYQNMPAQRAAVVSYESIVNTYINIFDIDQGTALLGPSLADYLKRTDGQKNWGPEAFMTDVVEHWISRNQNTEVELFAKLQHVLTAEQGSPEYDEVVSNLKALSMNDVLNDLRAFQSQYISKDGFDPRKENVPVSGQMKLRQDICKEITARRLAVLRAVQNLSRQ